MKISVITPNYNSGLYLEETVKSVLAINHGDIELEYIIVDGNSTDESARTIDMYKDRVSHVIRERDNSMYDALSKGLACATGDYVCYINAGDIIFPTAFKSISKAIKKHNWITCRKLLLNEEGSVYRDLLPCKFFSTNICTGLNAGRLEYIQQESTIWKNNLLTKSDLKNLSKFKYAGDYYIWYKLAKKGQKLVILDTIFGAFRIHANQLSENKLEYIAEVDSFADRITLIAIFTYMLSLTLIIVSRTFFVCHRLINNGKCAS